MSDIAEYVDVALKVGNLAALLGGGLMLVRKMGQDASDLKSSFQVQTSRVESTLAQQNVVVEELRVDIRALNKLVTEVAVQTQRMDAMSERMNRQDKIIDDALRELRELRIRE